jgi:NTE family protein
MVTLGYVMSGGGARGIAHVGVLKALDEAGIRPGIVSATSSGAIVGALYCAGLSPDAIMNVVRETKLIRWVRLKYAMGGILNIRVTRKIFEKYLLHDDFSQLHIPLVINATDVSKGNTVYFEEGSVIDAVQASSAVPVAFNPVVIDDCAYVDGGILNNMPAEVIRPRCEVLIGFHCNPVSSTFRPRGVRSMIERMLLLSVYANATGRKQLCDLVLEPPEMASIGAMQFSKAEQIFDIGYRYGLSQIELVLSALERARQHG